jgi:hypothetical protein
MKIRCGRFFIRGRVWLAGGKFLQKRVNPFRINLTSLRFFHCAIEERSKTNGDGLVEFVVLDERAISPTMRFSFIAT